MLRQVEEGVLIVTRLSHIRDGNVMSTLDNRVVTEPESEKARLQMSDLAAERQIWSLFYGPCFCHANPDSASFDFVRFRTANVDPGLLAWNTLVVSDRVIDGSASTFHLVNDQLQHPKLVIAARTCPNAAAFWDNLPVSWTPVSKLVRVDGEISECVRGKPEELLIHVLSAQSRSLRQPEAV